MGSSDLCTKVSRNRSTNHAHRDISYVIFLQTFIYLFTEVYKTHSVVDKRQRDHMSTCYGCTMLSRHFKDF